MFIEDYLDNVKATLSSKIFFFNKNLNIKYILELLKEIREDKYKNKEVIIINYSYNLFNSYNSFNSYIRVKY